MDIFFSKNKKKINCDLLIDEVTSDEEASRFSSLIKEFKTHVIISKKDINKKFNYYKFDSMKGCARSIIFPNFFKYFFSYLFMTIKSSIILKTNFFTIALHVLKRIIKYDTLFSQINGRYLLQERHYTTSSIKNFQFKKYGGKVTACLQKNTIHIMNNGFYINTDLFFSLGNKTTELENFRGLEVKKFIPVGSLFMESKWFFTKRIDVPEYDILNICSSNLLNFSTHESYELDYYEHYKWMAKISSEYPELKIALKYPAGYKVVDKKEIEIIKNTGIERITTGVGRENYSYGYAQKAKFICAWNSTVIYEMLGHNKVGFFLDPGGRNTVWMHKNNYNDPWRLKSYEEFKKKVEGILFSDEKVKVDNSQNFCIDSNNVSKKISENLYNYVGVA